MAKIQEKIKAIHLRKIGKSISYIAKNVKVSKSSVSLWCSSITLTAKQKEVLHNNLIIGGNIGRMIGTNVNRQKRELNLIKAKEEAKYILSHLSKRDFSMIALGLYWGEGSKNSERKFVFTNSDVKSIKCIMRWLLILGIKKSNLVASIYINEQHQDRISIVKKYWLKGLGINNLQFRKTILVKTKNKKIYANRNTYFGVLRLTCKNSSYLKYLIMGMLEQARREL